jgi:HK97 family phage major capsid protein
MEAINKMRDLTGDDIITFHREAVRAVERHFGVPRPALYPGEPTESSSRTGGAPSLMPTVDDVEGFRVAVSERRPWVAARAITSTTNALAAAPDVRLQPVAELLSEQFRVASLISAEQTDRSSVEYFAATAGADQAAAVAEGADKPLSDPAWEKRTAVVSKIAHYGTATDEGVRDFSSSLQLFQSVFIRGLIDAENDALLTGSGTPPEPQGILNNGGIQDNSTGDNALDVVLGALNKLQTGSAFTKADAIILHPDVYLVTVPGRGGNSGWKST